MKPSRGKRRGPYRPAAGFSPSARRRRRRRILAERVGVACGGRRPYFPRSERHDRFAGGEKLPGGVTGASASERTGPASVGPSADRGRPFEARRRPPAVRARSTRGDRSRCPRTARAYRPDGPASGRGSVADRPATCPTRLETRTKESNTRASRWALRNPKAQ